MVAVPVPKSRPANLMQRETRDQRDRRRAIQNVEQQLRGRVLKGAELTPAGLAERRSETLDALKGTAVGLPAGLLGLPADLLALIMRDAPQAAAQLASGKSIYELKIEDRTLVDKAVSKFQEYAGAEAVARYMGFGDNLDEDPAEFESSTLGMNPFRQGMLAGEIIADPLLAYKLFTKFKGLGPSTRESQALMEAAPTVTHTGLDGDQTQLLDFTPEGTAADDFEFGNYVFPEERVHTPTGRTVPAGTGVRGRQEDFAAPRTPDLAPGPVEAPGITMGAPLDLPNELTLPNELPLADRVDLTNQFEDLRVELARQELDEAEGIATLPAAEDVVDVEPVVQAALTPIRTEGQQVLRQQAFPITEQVSALSPSANENRNPFLRSSMNTSETADPDLQRGIAVIDEDYRFPNLKVGVKARALQGDVADYSPTFQTIDSLPEGTYTKQQVKQLLEAQPDAASRDLKGSGFIEYLDSVHSPSVYPDVDSIRADYRKRTPQLKVRTVTNNEISDFDRRNDEGLIREDQDTSITGGPFEVLPGEYMPFAGQGQHPSSGQQTFFPDDNPPLDRGVVILSNPNTRVFTDPFKVARSSGGGKKNSGVTSLRTPHNYFGGSSGGVPGYIAHHRFAIANSENGKRISVLEETQGNTVSETARGISEKMTPATQARIEAITEDSDFVEHTVLQTTAQKLKTVADRVKKDYEDLASGNIANLSDGNATVFTDELLDVKPEGEIYTRAFNTVQEAMKTSDGYFDKLDQLPYQLYGDDIRKILRESMSAEDKAYIDNLLATYDVRANLYREDPEELVTFETLTYPDMDDGSSGLVAYKSKERIKEMIQDGDFPEDVARDLEVFVDQSAVMDDLGQRSLYSPETKIYDVVARKQASADEKIRSVKERLTEIYGQEEYDKMVSAVKALDGGTDKITVGQPFATTRDFDEYMPRLFLQEMVKRTDVDQVFIPNYKDLQTVGSRGVFERRPEAAAGFKNTYDKGLKKSLNKLKADFPEFKYEVVDNFVVGNVTMDHPGILIDLQDPAIRAMFENRVIRRAKGGPVDLRPKKMIHSGIGAMAREMM